MSIRSQKSLQYGTFDYSSTKNSINFSYGLPDPESFCKLTWPNSVFNETGVNFIDLLQYTDSAGLPELRTRISHRYNTEYENVMITNGASQGMQLVADAFIDLGDVVLTEDPSYLGALRIFSSAGADIVQLPMDNHGVNLDHLEEFLSTSKKRISFFYSSSVFHNPTGLLLNKQRMTEVRNLLQKYNILMVQDLVYSELHYDNSPPEILSAGSNVINLYSFSKIASPGLRVGWLLGDANYIQTLSCLKRDGGVSPIASNVVLGLLGSPVLDKHIEWLRSHYKNKRDLMYKMLMASDFCEAPSFLPQGGFSFWVKISDDVEVDILISMLHRAYDIKLTHGVHYGQSSSKHIRLCFSYMSIEKIEFGLQCIEDIYKKIKR